MDSAELQAAVVGIHAELKPREKTDRAAVVVPVSLLPQVMKTLRDDSRFGFDMLCAHTAIDWPNEQKIELVYQLYSAGSRQYLMVCTSVPRAEPVAPSVSSIWRIAEWQEREVYDLFGVRYSGHPDLRRLMLEDDWVGHPLLKDYKDGFMLERPW